MSDNEFYSRFSENLKTSQKWPGIYMFKFVIKEKETKKQNIENLFKEMNAKFSIKKSSKKNFTSITVTLVMDDPESVIKIYKDVSKFKGVITL
tara:strand:+ start:130 stop:408 length:279 start_codon:yes stop_codon:yes gene_type:complete